jgi:hypothetical protein
LILLKAASLPGAHSALRKKPMKNIEKFDCSITRIFRPRDARSPLFPT